MPPAQQVPFPLDGEGGQKRPRRAPKTPGGSEPPPPPPVPDTSLAEEAQRKYLNYALSVITSRALPDVRDGLKPVQRRILYAMLHDLHLAPDGRFRKSAAVVGDVMGKYHPHGDTAIYDAMVRLAQDFVMRAPLVAGHGNFGSIDGDAPAAMRYTEAKLRPLALELLGELGKRTVEWRPNYDGTKSEPVILPSRFPNLLVNGSQGIAVGMATSIPPHNLAEVLDACIELSNQRDLPVSRLLKKIKGPDFPTGGQLHATKEELEAVYTTGQGSLKLRGEWKVEEDDSKRGPSFLVITSIPYGVERKAIVEKIAEVIISKKLPPLLDVRDESTDLVRIVLETKRGTDPQLVMAYLYKHTPLAVHVPVNLTCLVPTDNPDVSAPKRLGLDEILNQFLTFRYSTVTRRLEFDLGELKARIHVLEGLEIVFDALDEVIAIIRKSEGKADAASKLIKRFELSEEQTDAILELRLYRLARLEIQVVRKELADKRTEAKRLEALLKSDTRRWDLVRDELAQLKEKYGDRRRTKIMGAVDEPEFQAEDFIVAEDANIVLSSQGWVKRVRELKDPSATRLREGDSVLAAVAGSTRSAVAFFSNLGACYVCRIHDIPPSTGYGDPVQKLFKLADGERMVAMMSLDPRALGEELSAPTEGAAEPEPPFALALTRGGLGFRFSLRQHREPSTRAGRKFAKLNEGDDILAVLLPSAGRSIVCVASNGYALGVPVEEIGVLSGAGKGAIVMKLDENERVIGAMLDDRDVIQAETEKGKVANLVPDSVLGARGEFGRQVFAKKDRVVRIVPPPVATPVLGKPSEEES
ncbi:DNA topoisomerase (ATP-hydrolyzing) [Polyangium sp. 15x6]|uniref:DNA gyrase/topoisomerase IV subunit A n=1 Tax=Polyangium sp. 15x6 TaxID=3042687 RepID=UPI00249BB798|nr:DNA topoisomerase (ATP-hydrolyzing) [Polyangium sp. 15x6]MDI3283997.1 DNA topoisomerase 4 subunit A [Polyangium sp. 15x6]